jgi:hypothetical protein
VKRLESAEWGRHPARGLAQRASPASESEVARTFFEKITPSLFSNIFWSESDA